tara:strand:- start:11565 stop:11852 length:288 start_codon:yes stop_codon:yes gene_type:complete
LLNLPPAHKICSKNYKIGKSGFPSSWHTNRQRRFLNIISIVSEILPDLVRLQRVKRLNQTGRLMPDCHSNRPGFESWNLFLPWRNRCPFAGFYRR